MRRISAWMLMVFPMVLVSAQSARFERIEEHFTAGTDRPLEVMIDVDAGAVQIEPSGDSRSIDIFIRYVREDFRHRIDFDEEKNRLRIVLDKESWWRKSGFRDDTHSRVDVGLPHGTELFFDGQVKAGEANLEMGGLPLREFYFRNLAGEVDLRFGEPNPVEMEFLDVDAKVGEMRLSSLGNARFQKAILNGGIGEMRIDFSGALLDESRAKVDLDIGETTIFLPEEAGVRLEIGGGLRFLSHKEIDGSLYRRGPAYYSEDYDRRDRGFFLYVRPGLGELRIER